MKFELYNGLNAVIKEMIIVNDDTYLTPEKIYMLSHPKVSIDLPTIGDYVSIPNTVAGRDEYGKTSKSVGTGYPYGGMLRDQSKVLANTIYIGRMDNRYIYVLSPTEVAWTKGSEIPSSTMTKIDMKTFAGL